MKLYKLAYAFWLLFLSSCIIVEEDTPDPIAIFEVVSNRDGVVEFKNISQFAMTYRWDFGDGNGSTEVTPKHTYTSAGTYEVTLIAEGLEEKTNSTSRSVTYEPFISVSTPTSIWEQGQPVNITWTDNISENVKIELYKGSSLSQTIVNSTASDGSYSYTVPSSLSADNDYHLRISSTSNSNVYGESNVFSVINIDMVSVSGGTFEMGCKSGRDDINGYSCSFNETPLHSVTVSSFRMSTYEITNAQYVEFLNAVGVSANGSFNDSEFGTVEYIGMGVSDVMITHNGTSFEVRSHSTDLSNYPVIEVTWYGANAFCKWAGGRLPTEAEWEFAARGGNSSQGYQFSGSNTVDDVAWYGGNSNSSGQSNWNSVRTHSVGTKSANELGLYDMSGNVWEWCGDWYGSYSGGAQTDPTGPSSGNYRVARSGSWLELAAEVHACLLSQLRQWPKHHEYEYGSGFRLVVLP